MQASQLMFNEIERIAFINGRSLTAMCAAKAADIEQMEDNMCAVRAHIDEAKAQFPEEDFLQELIDDLIYMSERRVTKADVKEIADRLTELQAEVNRSTEYGLDELRKARILTD